MTTLGIRHEDWQLSPHGTLAAYRRHYRRGEQPCESCRQANARYQLGQRSRDAYNTARRERYAAARAAGLSAREAKSVRASAKGAARYLEAAS